MTLAVLFTTTPVHHGEGQTVTSDVLRCVLLRSGVLPSMQGAALPVLLVRVSKS